MTSREPSWNEVLDRVITSRLRSVHTALPGTIRSYDAATVTATVELAVQLEAAAGAFETVPPLDDVPVATPGAWASGDRCLVVFCEEDFSKWFDTDSVEPPAVLQRHGLHAVCVPFGASAGQAVQFVALANLVTDQLTALKDAINGWTPVPNDGGAALKTALTSLFATWPGSVAATKLQAR